MFIGIYNKFSCKYMKFINKYKKLSANIWPGWNSRFQHFGLSARLILPDTFVRNTLSSFQGSHPFWKWPDPAKLCANLSLDRCQHPWTIIPASSISAVNSPTSKDIWEKSLTSVLLALVICAKSNLDYAFQSANYFCSHTLYFKQVRRVW